MASTYSTNLAIELLATGDQANAWGNTTNTNLGTLIEQAVSGYVTQTINDGADTVITIPNGASGTARNMYIEMTGALTAVRNMIVPSNKKLYFIYNNTTGGYSVTVKVSGLTGVVVPNGKKMVLVSNGTDVVEAINYFSAGGTVTGVTASSPLASSGGAAPNITLGTVTVANGGTGLTSYAVGDIIYASGTTTLSALADVATGNALISGGVGVAPSWGKIDLTTHVSGTLPIGNGGTGVTTTPTNGQLLIGNGSGYAVATLTGSSAVTVTNAAGSVTLDLSNSGVVAGTYNRVTVDAKGRATSGTQVITETVYNLSGTAIDPANGTIQYKTLTGNTTFTESLASGQSVTLLLNSGGFTITWSSITNLKWRGGAAPTITSTAGRYSLIEFFKANVGSDNVFASYVGDFY